MLLRGPAETKVGEFLLGARPKDSRARPRAPRSRGMPEPDPGLDRALDRIWTRARPKLLARVDAIDRAIDALDGDANPDVIDTGRDAAHKITGLAGTFDLDDATRLARGLERALEDRAAADPAELRRQAGELRAVLEG